MSEMVDFWKSMDTAKARAKEEQDQTKGAIEAFSCPGGKWRFAGVREGPKWIARHRYEGEVFAKTSAALIERVKAITEKKSGRAK